MIARIAAPIAIPAMAPGESPDLLGLAVAVAEGVAAAAVVAVEVEEVVVEVADRVDVVDGPPSDGKSSPGLRENAESLAFCFCISSDVEAFCLYQQGSKEVSRLREDLQD